MSNIPKINTATYETVMPSTGKKVQYRPFNVREQKAILIAMQESDNTAILTTIKLLNACSNVKVDDLPVFDVEYLLMKVRAKSTGEVIDMNGVCECEYKTPITINLDEIKGPQNIPKLEPIKLTDNSSIKMHWPSLLDVASVDSEDDMECIIQLMAKCTSEIYVGEDTYVCAEQTPEDVRDFIESLTETQFLKIQDFIEHIPKLTHTLDFTCAKCGKTNSVPMEGSDSFFPSSV